MSQALKPASFLFYLLALLDFFLLGLFLAGITGAGEGQGLAGGAIVLFYGIIGAGLALVVAIYLAIVTNLNFIKTANKILGALFIVLAALSAWMIFSKAGERSRQGEINSIIPKPILIQNTQVLSDEQEAGMGFFKPNFNASGTLYFYNQPNFEKSLDEHLPQDSMTYLLKRSMGILIDQAPPWLNPVHMKLDYDLLYFKVVSVSEDFLGLIGNEADGKVVYVDRSEGEYFSWTDFLLQINSIEPLNKEKTEVLIKPLEGVSAVNQEYDFLKPVLIKDDWAKVILLNNNFKKNGDGWIRWRKDGKLMIKYSLLS
ncbi:MAG: phage holin family protein [Saprospiraceae bacterium]